ncbi:hypothetical protein HPB49_026153 [Dermacentor silvarum]|nr:hypothetical protein HPB49_026153 [Dermacentor silvarum]
MSQRRSVQDMPFLDHIELWHNDPVACAIYVNRLFDVILNILKDSRLSLFKPVTLNVKLDTLSGVPLATRFAKLFAKLHRISSLKLTGAYH